MKTALALLFVLGLLTAGWMNRHKISGLSSSLGLPLADGQDRAATNATPHPAAEARARATALYPALANTNSRMNQRFVALYKEAQASNPALLSEPDWPLKLAERALADEARPASPLATPGKQVVIYTSAHCPYCTKAKQYMAQKGVRYREVNIDTSSSGKQEYRRLGGTGVPLIMVGNTKVAGFDRAALDRLL